MPSLPAPATMTSPAFQASCTASSSDCEYSRLAEAHVDDVGAVGDRPGDGLLNGEIVAGPVGTTDLVGEDASVWRHANDAFRPLPACRSGCSMAGGDRSRDVSAVAVIVHRVAVAKDEVVAAGVVRRQVRVRVVDAGVDHRHRDVGAAPGDRPGFRGIDVGVWRAAV